MSFADSTFGYPLHENVPMTLEPGGSLCDELLSFGWSERNRGISCRELLEVDRPSLCGLLWRSISIDSRIYRTECVKACASTRHCVNFPIGSTRVGKQKLKLELLRESNHRHHGLTGILGRKKNRRFRIRERPDSQVDLGRDTPAEQDLCATGLPPFVLCAVVEESERDRLADLEGVRFGDKDSGRVRLVLLNDGERTPIGESDSACSKRGHLVSGWRRFHVRFRGAWLSPISRTAEAQKVGSQSRCGASDPEAAR